MNKGGYWYSEAGGRFRRFGKVKDVPKAEAMRRLWEALAEDEALGVNGIISFPRAEEPEPGERNKSLPPNAPKRRSQPKAKADALPQPSSPFLSSLTVDALAEAFLAWLGRNRSDRTLEGRRLHLERFQRLWGGLDALALDETHLEVFIEGLKAEGYAPDYVRKHVISVKAMISRGIRLRLLPNNFDPFATVEALRVEPRALLESDLPSREEVLSLIASAKGLMRDVVLLYHATGARTHELIEARCRDFQPSSRTLVLARHKRSRTMRQPMPRAITLNDLAFAIVERLSQGRQADDFVIRNGKGDGYSRFEIARRFATVRKHAQIRSSISLYSFRHLWISEALMTGLDAMLVARMAGTSVRMIESVYGHFRAQSLAEAQARLDAQRMGWTKKGRGEEG